MMGRVKRHMHIYMYNVGKLVKREYIYICIMLGAGIGKKMAKRSKGTRGTPGDSHCAISRAKNRFISRWQPPWPKY